MCTVSMVGDFYRDNLPNRHPWINITSPTFAPVPPVSREEFEALKRDVADMKELLKRAKAYDEANGEPDCELDEKVALLRRVAELVGVSLDDVLGAKPA